MHIDNLYALIDFALNGIPQISTFYRSGRQ